MSSLYLSVVKAEYDYTATSEDELTIEEGSVYYLVDNSDADWSKVRVKSDQDDAPLGLVPSAYLKDVEPISYAKAQYDYEAIGDGELTIKEGEELLVLEKDDDWWLVKNTKPDSRLGLVPGNYLEERPAPSSSEVRREAAHGTLSSGTYMDPQERVAKSHEKPSNDIMATWSISEIDKKGRKKKGKLGIANGFVFFASESDKTPVRQWPSTSVTATHTDKPKHVVMEVGGPSRESLHFSAGSKDVAEDIVAKLGSSRVVTDSVANTTEELPHVPLPTERKAVKVKKSVNFSSGPVEVIGSTGGDDDVESPSSGEVIGLVLYDFVADGDDELAVTNGEHVVILDRESSDDWWRVRNQHGHEGVIPALYVQVNEDGVPVADQQSQDVESYARPAREGPARPKERAEEERMRVEAEVKREAAELAKAAASEQARKGAAEQQATEKERVGREVRREAERQRRDEVENARAEVSRKREPNSKPSKDKTRIWHDRTGQFRVEAEYRGMRNGKLSLHKTNGVTIEVPAEKMSPADITYVENLEKRKNEPSTPDDEIPLAQLPAASNRVSAPKPTPTPTKRSNVDWFTFFLNAGCDIDDCTRYASAFERDKIDEAILPDLEGSTLRTLGLREGDIIRVTKFIKQKTRSASSDTKAGDDAVLEQVKKDEELARRLQAQGDVPTPQRTSSTSPAPNLFSGANGVLKKQRRGRLALEPKLSSTTVDVAAIENATAQMRVGTPQTPVRSPEAVAPGPPARKSTTHINGFEDDAWAPRPSSTVGIKPAPTVATPPLPAPTPPQAPQPPPVTAPPSNSSTGQSTQRPSTTTPSGSSSQFDLLAQIRQMRPPSAPIPRSPAGAQPSPVSASSISPPVGYNAGLGASHSPSPIGQFLTAQQTGALPPPQPLNGPRGPFAPIPQNRGLLSPLVPTNSTINNSFIPTRPLQSQPTGFPQNNLIAPQITGVPLNFQQPLQVQPTGLGNSFGNFGPTPTGGGLTFNNPSDFQNGLQPQLQQRTSFDTFANSGPPPPPPGNNTSPASVFASMKAGTFGNNSASQSADKYDALRSPNGAPSFLSPQPTGWGGGAQVNFNLQPQPTGFQPNQFDPNGLQAQPTGYHGGFQQSQFGGFR